MYISYRSPNATPLRVLLHDPATHAKRVTCFETTDHGNGIKKLQESVENIRFARQVMGEKQQPGRYLSGSSIGARAPFTVPRCCLEMLLKLSAGRGLPFHAAKPLRPFPTVTDWYGKRLLARLASHRQQNASSLMEQRPDREIVVALSSRQRDAFLFA